MCIRDSYLRKSFTVEKSGAFRLYITAHGLYEACLLYTSSIMSILMTIAQGLGQSILLGGINLFGYIAPEAADQVIVQPEAVQTFFNWCFVGGGLISLLGGTLAMTFFDEMCIRDRLETVFCQSAGVNARIL